MSSWFSPKFPQKNSTTNIMPPRPLSCALLFIRPLFHNFVVVVEMMVKNLDFKFWPSHEALNHFGSRPTQSHQLEGPIDENMMRNDFFPKFGWWWDEWLFFFKIEYQIPSLGLRCSSLMCTRKKKSWTPSPHLLRNFGTKGNGKRVSRGRWHCVLLHGEVEKPPHYWPVITLIRHK